METPEPDMHIIRPTLSAEMRGHETRRAYSAVWEKSILPCMLAGLVVAAMLLRLGLVLALPRVIWGDEVDYVLLGRNLLNGQGFTNPDGSSHLVFPHCYHFVFGSNARLVSTFAWACYQDYV